MRKTAALAAMKIPNVVGEYSLEIWVRDPRGEMFLTALPNSGLRGQARPIRPTDIPHSLPVARFPCCHSAYPSLRSLLLRRIAGRAQLLTQLLHAAMKIHSHRAVRQSC